MKISAASTAIAPMKELDLGCGRMEGTGWAVDSEPELNAVALWFDSAPPLILISVDALYPGSRLRSFVEKSAPNVPAANIVLGASHTHAAPMLDATKPILGAPDEEHMRHVECRVRGLMQQLLYTNNRTEAQIFAASGRADHSVNRRFNKRIYWGWPLEFNERRMGPNFWGSRDEQVTLLDFRDGEGRSRAMIWNYACHPVAFPKARTVSAHYPGVVRALLREAHDPDFPVVFFQGFSGDTRPMYTAEDRFPPGPRHLYRRLRFGPVWRPATMERYSAWTSSLAQRVVSLAERARLQPNVGEYDVQRVLDSRTNFVSPEGSPVSFQAVRLGRAFGLLAVSGEVVSSYSRMARSKLGTRFTMCVGCTDETFGYLPTSRMVREGGYESEGFLQPFGLDGINPDVESNAKSAILSVTRRHLTGPAL